MSEKTIVPIVEGQSEVESVPILLRRLLQNTDRNEFVGCIAKPIRIRRNKIVKEGELEKTIHMARRSRAGCSCILIILDAGDDCPADLGPRLVNRAIWAWRAHDQDSLGEVRV
ncbi:MAG: hypothetical protein JW941_13300 [Candidatus Coatesbacteria bacterium]|nr:hypothetical protein [Candidatus Coatesbacteria bacterium]